MIYLKKKIFVYLLCFFLLFIISSSIFFNFNKKEKKNSLKKVTLAEVAHTIFYAPMYVSIEKGYFKDVGIDIDLILTSGADKVVAALVSGDADIGLSGSEATIYLYNGGEKDYLKTFAQLTQKDGSFLVSRKKYDSFQLSDLKGKTVIGGRSGGMPEMTFEYALKQNGIDPRSDLTIDTSIQFAAMSGAFIGGEGDFVTLFEPTASEVEKQGYGFVVGSIGEYGGVVPYTSFSSRIHYIEKHKDVISKFQKAILKGLNYIHEHSNLEVAKTIKNQFSDTSLEDLESAINRYRSIDAWPKTTKFEKESFDHLQDIMIDYGELKEKVDYEKLMYLPE